MVPENGISCEVCGSPIESVFRYCPFCGQQVNFTSFRSVNVPIPLGVILLAPTQIMFSVVMLAVQVVNFSIFITGTSLLNILSGILLFYGYRVARYMAILAAFLLAVVFLSIPIDLLIAVILVLYLTRPEVVAYFNQGPMRFAKTRKSAS